MRVKEKHHNIRNSKSNRKLLDVLKEKKKPLKSLLCALYHCYVTGTAAMSQGQESSIKMNLYTLPATMPVRQCVYTDQLARQTQGNKVYQKSFISVTSTPSSSTFPSPHFLTLHTFAQGNDTNLKSQTHPLPPEAS